MISISNYSRCGAAAGLTLSRRARYLICGKDVAILHAEAQRLLAQVARATERVVPS